MKSNHWIFATAFCLAASSNTYAADPAAGAEFKDCPTCPAMIVIPAGEFTMGSDMEESGHPDEKPQHAVKIAKPFAVAKFETTFDQWDACTADGKCPKVSDDDLGRADRPVINVAWKDAKTFIAWLS